MRTKTPFWGPALFLLTALSWVAFTDDCLSTPEKDKVRRFIDVKDPSSRYSDEAVAYLNEKFGPADQRAMPPGFQKLDTNFIKLIFLLKEQGFSEEEFLRYRIYDRLNPRMYAFVDFDTLGRIGAAIQCQATGSQSDALLAQKLAKCGADIRSVGDGWVWGYVPVFALEETANDTTVISMTRAGFSRNYHPLEKEPVVLHRVILGTLLFLSVLALIPRSIRIRGQTWFHFLPLLSIPLYIIYEWTMPGRYGIRLELLLIYPMLLACILSSIIKFILLKLSVRRADTHNVPQQ